MKWMRCRQGERELFGLLEGDRLAVHEGDLFGAARPTGERVDLAGAQWLMPCRPTKMLALWNNFRARGHDFGHVDIVEGRQHRGRVLRFLQPPGDRLAQARHPDPFLSTS